MDENTYTYASIHKKSRSPRVFSITFSLITLLAIVSMAFLLSAILYKSGISLFPKTNNASTYYALSAQSFNTQEETKAFAETITKKGGAGYVWQSSKYYVLMMAYDKKSDAEKVLSNIIADYPNSEIIELQIPATSQRYTELATINTAIKSLKDISIEFDQKLDSQKAITSINKITETLHNIDTVSIKGTDRLKIDTVVNIIIHQLDYITSLKLESNDLSSVIKYCFINTICSYRSLCTVL